jgi:hypothetical protein
VSFRLQLVLQGKTHDVARVVTDRAVGFNSSSVASGDTIGRCKPKSGGDPDALCPEMNVEDAFELFRSNAAARVLNLDLDLSIFDARAHPDNAVAVDGFKCIG